jgi:hypothetical protein
METDERLRIGFIPSAFRHHRRGGLSCLGSQKETEWNKYSDRPKRTPQNWPTEKKIKKPAGRHVGWSFPHTAQHLTMKRRRKKKTREIKK